MIMGGEGGGGGGGGSGGEGGGGEGDDGDGDGGGGSEGGGGCGDGGEGGARWLAGSGARCRMVTYVFDQKEPQWPPLTRHEARPCGGEDQPSELTSVWAS